jgi:hypothetical protein
MSVSLLNVPVALAFRLDSVIRRHTMDHGIDQPQATRVERELKRFLVLCAQEDAGFFSPPLAVDQLWHTFLLFTYEYAEFCATLGGGFIHHRPFDDSNGRPPVIRRSRHALFAAYERTFGEGPPADIWALDGSAAGDGGSGNCDAGNHG